MGRRNRDTIVTGSRENAHLWLCGSGQRLGLGVWAAGACCEGIPGPLHDDDYDDDDAARTVSYNQRNHRRPLVHH